MSYTTFVTDQGCKLLERSQLEGLEIQFTHFELGSGYNAESNGTIQALLEPKHTSRVNELYHDGEKLEIATYVPSVEISTPFAFREIGLYAQIGNETPILYIYSAKPQADFLGGDEVISHTFQFDLHISQGSSITVTLSDDVQWATKKELRGHIRNLENPHQVTKDQVGLGKLEDYPYLKEDEIESSVGLLKHMTHQTVKALVELYIENHRKQVNPHGMTKKDIDLGFVKNLPTTQLEEIANPLVNGWVESYLTPEMMYNLLKNLVKLGDLTLDEFKNGLDILYKSKLIAGTPNIEVKTDEETGQTTVSWIGSTIPNSVAWTDVGTVDDSPERNRQLVKYLAPYLLASDLMEGTNIAFTPVQYSDSQGNTKTKLRIECKIPEGVVYKNQFVDSHDVQVNLDSGRISFTVEALQKIQEELAKKLEMTEQQLTQFVESKVPIKKARSSNLQTATVQVVDGELVIDVKAQSGGGTGGSVDLSNYYTKQEADAKFALKGEVGGGGSGGSGPVDLSNYYTKQEIDAQAQRYLTGETAQLAFVTRELLQEKLGSQELTTEDKTLYGAINEVFQSASEGKLNIMAAIKARHPETTLAYTDPKTPAIVVANAILNIPSGTGFAPPEYNELIFGFPYMTQPNGYTGLQWQMGGNIAIASRNNILFVLTRTHEFNFQCARMEFDSDIRVIQISRGGKYFVIGFTDKWGVYQSSDLTEIHSLTTFHTATPQFTHDEIHLAYWQDTQSLILYNLQSKTSRLVKGTANPIKYISNDLNYYHSNYVYNIQDGKSVQCQGTVPNQYFNDKMYYVASGKLQRLTYSGTTQSVEDVLPDGVTSIICSNTHMVIWNGTSKTLTWYNSAMGLVKSIQNCKSLPNRLFGEYAMYDFTNNTFPRLYLGTEEIEFDKTWEHNYSVDGKTFYVKSNISGVNKVYRFQNKGQGFVLSGTLELENTINYMYCSPNGRNLALTSNSKLFLYTDMALVREVALSKYIPLDDLNYLIGTNGTLMKWDGDKYSTVYAGYGVNLNRELTMSTLNSSRTIEIYKLTEKLRFDLPETCTYCSKNLMIGPFKTYVMNTETGDWTSRPTTVAQPTFNITDTSYFVLGEGYSYMEGSSVAKINPYLKCTKAQGLTLFGTQHVTCLEQVQ